MMLITNSRLCRPLCASNCNPHISLRPSMTCSGDLIRIMNPARINLHRGCTHAYVSKNNSSKRTRAAKAVLQDSMKRARRRAETKSKRRRGAQKQLRIDGLLSLEVSPSKCVSETMCDSSHIFYAPRGLDILPPKSDDLQRKPRLQRDVTSLKVIDTTNGCTLSGDDGIPTFTLIPRHVVLGCTGNAKATELKLLKRLSEVTKQTTRGSDREGLTTKTKFHIPVRWKPASAW